MAKVSQNRVWRSVYVITFPWTREFLWSRLPSLRPRNGIKAQVIYVVCRGHLTMHFLVKITRLMRETWIVKSYLMACIWWSANPLCGVLLTRLGWYDFQQSRCTGYAWVWSDCAGHETIWLDTHEGAWVLWFVVEFFGNDFVSLCHTYSKHSDRHRSFWHPNMADAWVFTWAVFGDEFGKSDRKNRGFKNPVTVGARYQDNFRGCAAVRFSETLRSSAQIPWTS